MRQGSVNREAIANRLDGSDTRIIAQEISHDCHHYDSDQRTGNLFRHLRREGDQQDAEQANTKSPEVDGMSRTEIGDPFGDEICGHLIHRQAEKIFHLRGEDGQGDTTRKAYDNRVGDELDHRT